MGIKGLNKLIKQYAPESIIQENIDNFKGSKIAIDGELLLHKFKTSDNISKIYGDSLDINNSHIYGFLINVFWYMDKGITPVYVFDGCPNEAKKNNAIYKRTQFKEQLIKKYEEYKKDLINHKDYNKETGEPLSEDFNTIYDKIYKIEKKMSCMNVPSKYRQQIKYLLKLLGIPFVVAAEDAEAYCILLQQSGYVDYVYTEDTDAIPYYLANMNREKNIPLKIFKTTNYSKNPYYLFKDFSNNYVNKYDTVTILDVNVLVKKLEMTNESLIDLCIMCGCDFCPAYPKINYEKAYNYIKKYEIIENFINAGNINYPEFRYKEARNIFYISYEISDFKKINYEQIDKENLKKYLKEERHINYNLIDNIINKYNKLIIKFNDNEKTKNV